MNVLLYPPILQGVIPAQYGNTLKIPYTMNKAVSLNEIHGFQIKISTVQNGIKVIEGKTSKDNCTSVKITYSDDNLEKLEIGNFYKLQICYYYTINGTDETSPYSTAAIFKYTGIPKVEIKNLSSDQNINNNHIFNYIGSYTPDNNDPSEKLYSSIFRIYDSNNNIYLESEEILHNCLLDTRLEETESHTFSENLPEDKIYRLQFEATTINGLIVNSPYYKIIQPKRLDAPTGYQLEAELDYENGAVNLNLIIEKNINNKIAFLRSSNDSNYLDWTELFQQTIRFNKETGKSFTKKNIWKDFTVEHGKSYKYAICLVNSQGGYSSRLESNEVPIDFEDIFLFDGEKNLKIRFNQNISSFKENILETKIDTIGNKYPYFFRNGNVKYKEFPITGIISFLQDDNGYFSENLYNKRSETLEYGLNATTFKEELDFRLEVLNWLNNSQLKLFKSCSEGNFLVRLMNVSLSPLSNGINRLIYSFSCTAYEAGEKNDKNLKEKKFFNQITDLEKEEMEYKTFNLSFVTRYNDFIEEYLRTPIYDATFYTNQDCRISINDQIIYIYSGFNLGKDFKIEKLSGIDGEDYSNGIITFGYYPPSSKFFSGLSTISTRVIPYRQIIGLGKNQNILDLLSDKKTKLDKILTLSLRVRPIVEIQHDKGSNSYYLVLNGERACSHDLNTIFIYKKENKYYTCKIELNNNEIKKVLEEITDITDNSYLIETLNGTQFAGNVPSFIQISNLNLKDVKIGTRLYAEITYSSKVINYVSELEDSTIKNFSETYSKELSDLNIDGITELETLEVQKAYDDLINKLNE